MQMGMGRLLAAIGLISSALGGSARQAPANQVVGPVEYYVTVRSDADVEPGVPLMVSVKTRAGKAIAEVRTDGTGKARFRLAPEEVLAAARLEVLMDLGAGRSVGVIETLKPECNSYHVFLPRFELSQCHGEIQNAR